MSMRAKLALAVAVLCAALIAAGPARPQAGAQTGTTKAAPGGGSSSSKPADLSGVWGHDERGDFLAQGIVPSISLADPTGMVRGAEPDIPYQPWARQKTLSEVSSFDHFGPGASDPWLNYCEPMGLLRIYIPPARVKFIQTPNTVYILNEFMQNFRVVRLNSKHPANLKPTWFGDSIGYYENGDTLVVDTIGVNDKTWLDEMGHPHSDKMHLTERYRRVDAGTLQLDAIVDDPGAYTKPFAARRIFQISKIPFMQTPWICSLRDNQKFFGNIAEPASEPEKK